MKRLASKVKICYHWPALLRKRQKYTKNAKKKRKNVLHPRRPVGQELQKTLQACLAYVIGHSQSN